MVAVAFASKKGDDLGCDKSTIFLPQNYVAYVEAQGGLQVTSDAMVVSLHHFIF